MKKKTGIATIHMLLDTLGGNEGLANRLSAVPNSEQITPSPGQLGVGETKTRWMNAMTSLQLAPPSTLTTSLFEASWLLTVFPASIGTLINIWCINKPSSLYLESISDSRSEIYQELDSWSPVIFRVGLIIPLPYLGWHPDYLIGGMRMGDKRPPAVRCRQVPGLLLSLFVCDRT
ncbi:hypothetical protein M405DRAFT_232973 [Rhizopogon salebrosus TDB-379]|nr:hypothetical protein M405DRAFT_232973 [Rhizopogon salebrosus TDB-379]